KEIAAQAQAIVDRGPERHYIQGASFDQREQFKTAGAEWDPEAKAWFHTDKKIAEDLRTSISSSPEKSQKHYIQGTSFELKEQLKELGCQWDAASKQWYHLDQQVAAKTQEVVDRQARKSTPAPELKAAAAGVDLAASTEADHGL